jgi:hypothetical protein
MDKKILEAGGKNMWTATTTPLARNRVVRTTIASDKGALTFSDVITLWQTNEAFCDFFNQLLADSSFAAFRWETPGVRTQTLSQDFEFVLLDSPGLDRDVEPDAFVEHFTGEPDGVVVFSNLSGDATLVVPNPSATDDCYGHLAAFVRRAPAPQRHALWAAVGETLAKRVSKKPVWLSTAGAGVSWLHVRLDSRPKYYGYQPYADRS